MSKEAITAVACSGSGSEDAASGLANTKRELKKSRLNVKNLEAKVKSLEKELENILNKRRSQILGAEGLASDSTENQRLKALEEKVSSSCCLLAISNYIIEEMCPPNFEETKGGGLQLSHSFLSYINSVITAPSN